MSSIIPNDYAILLNDIKQRIRSAQYEALKAVNKELISLYWDIGRMIIERQKGESWGKSVVEQLAQDLQAEFPGISGFSAQNLWRMKQFYQSYVMNTKLSPLVREIGWTHNIIILCKSKDKTIVEYALRESNKPIGVAAYRMVTTLPEELRGQLPEPEQIAKLLEGVE